MNAELRSAIQHDFAQLRAEVQHGFEDLKEVIRDAKNQILKAFYSAAHSNYERMAAGEHDSAFVRERLVFIKSRMTEVERRLNQPPSQSRVV